MNRPHFSLKVKPEEHKIDKVQSSLARYCVTALLCILICSVGFVFLMFQTDTIFSVDSNVQNVTVQNPRVTVTSTTSAVEKDKVSVPGVAPSSTVGEGFYKYDEDIYAKLMESGIGGMCEQRAKTIAALYVHAADYGLIALAGIGGNICGEGYPGLCQYYKNHQDWNGPGTGTSVSTPSNPLIVRTSENISCVENSSSFGGVGCMQFTSKEYRVAVAQYYKKYMPADDMLSDDDLRAAEIEYIVTDILPAKEGIKSCTEVSQAADWWLVNYEKPGFSHSDERCTAAEQIYKVFGGN